MHVHRVLGLVQYPVDASEANLACLAIPALGAIYRQFDESEC